MVSSSSSSVLGAGLLPPLATLLKEALAASGPPRDGLWLLPALLDLMLRHATLRLPADYEEFRDVFYPSTTNVLPSHTVHDHSISLIDDQQPPFGPMYSRTEAEQNGITLLCQH